MNERTNDMNEEKKAVQFWKQPKSLCFLRMKCEVRALFILKQKHLKTERSKFPFRMFTFEQIYLIAFELEHP